MGTAIVAVVAGGGFLAWQFFKPAELPDAFAKGNGRIEATEHDVSTKRPTRIIKVLVKEGDLVEPGQVVVRMDTADLEADLRTSEAQLAQAREDLRRAIATVTQRQSELRRADATITQRESELLLAGQDVERAQPLLAPGAINRQEFDQYVSRKATAEAVLTQARAAREADDAALTTARIDIDFRQKAIDAAVARVQRIQTDIDDSTLKSPILGRVQVKVAEPGEVLAAGGRVLNLIDLTDVYMTFFLPTATAGRVSIGAEVRLVLDAAPDLVIPARTTFVSDVAQFTPKTVETKVEREKLMFRIKAHIPPELLKQHIRMVKTGLPGVAYVQLDPNAKWPDHLAVKLPQ